MSKSISSSGHSHAGMRALVVDDDPLICELLTAMLGDCGIRSVSSADDGDSAQRALTSAAPLPDVVLCDLNMPRRDGFLLMEFLAASNYPGGVIVVSGEDARVLNSAALMARFHRLNIVGTLAKPVQAAELAAALSSLHGGAVAPTTRTTTSMSR